MARGLGDIIVSSRPYDEYRAMFGLTDAEILAGPVLDCPGGAGSFAAEVRDRGGRAARAPGSGHGLIGMRERAALYGGSVQAGWQPGGGFRVRARLTVEGGA